MTFENETARTRLIGPENSLLKKPQAVSLDLLVHRDRQANAAVIEVGGKRVVLKPGQWSRWVRLSFTLSTPSVLPNKTVTGVCRFYLQEVAPNFR